MKHYFTFLLCFIFTSIVFGQRPTDVIMKTDTKPVIDGVLDDDIWDVANVNNIDKPYTGETPTLGSTGETNWRALWDDQGIYVFITVTDDIFLPVSAGTGAAYMYDHAEIYMDVNFNLEDGNGPLPDGNGNGNGHYQFADDIEEGIEDGSLQTRPDDVQYAILVDGTNYYEEYFIPFSKLKTSSGASMDKTQEIGFDITIIDNDEDATPNAPVRNRAVWSNDGSITSESWNNLDEAGRITLDGAEAGVPIDEITIAGGAITQDNQLLQMEIAELLPEDVTDSSVVWYVFTPEGSTGRATISTKGVLTPILNGDVVVYATSPDEYAESNRVVVNISGQVVTPFEVSVIKNGDFVMGDDGLDKWNDINNSDYVAVSEEGYLSISATPQTNRWDIGLGQTLTDITDENAGDSYTLKFKAWSSNENDEIPLILEDINNNYPKNALIEVPAEWTKDDGSDVQLPITDEPQWFEFPVSFPNWQNNSSQYSFSFQIGSETGTYSFDSITLVNNADLEYISTSISLVNNNATFKVYPNPATSKINIDLQTTNTKVEIYNSVGIKVEETIVPGNHGVIDISNYTRGLYFIKANNSVVKFVR